MDILRDPENDSAIFCWLLLNICNFVIECQFHRNAYSQVLFLEFFPEKVIETILVEKYVKVDFDPFSDSLLAPSYFELEVLLHELRRTIYAMMIGLNQPQQFLCRSLAK